MKAFAYFCARPINDKQVEARLFLNNGQLLTVDHTHIFRKLGLKGLPRNLCIEPTDTYSQDILIKGLKFDQDHTFYIKTTTDEPNDKTVVDALKDLFRVRHGQLRLLPHNNSLRECDLLKLVRDKIGFNEDLEFGKNCKLHFNPPSEGMVKVDIKYTSQSGKEFNFETSYAIAEVESPYKVDDKLHVQYIGEDEVISKAFGRMAELGTSVKAVANDRISVKWGYLDKPKFRQALYEILTLLPEKDKTLEETLTEVEITHKLDHSVGTRKGIARVWVEGNSLHADIVI